MGLSKIRISFPSSLPPSLPLCSPPAHLTLPWAPLPFSSAASPFSASALCQNPPAPLLLSPPPQTPLCHRAQQEGGSDTLKKYLVLLLCSNSLHRDKPRSCAGTEPMDPTCHRTQTFCRSQACSCWRQFLQTLLTHGTSKHSCLSAFHSSTALLKLQLDGWDLITKKVTMKYN